MLEPVFFFFCERVFDVGVREKGVCSALSCLKTLCDSESRVEVAWYAAVGAKGFTAGFGERQVLYCK